MRYIYLFALPFLFAFVSNANAQCRVGSGPDMGDGIPYCSDLGPQIQQSYSPKWQSKWGAIAIDPMAKTGGIGFAENLNSKKIAEKFAIEQCLATGGSKTCRVEVSYDNQCGVIAWGDKYYTTANAQTVEDASSLALELCDKKTENCKIFYSNCNYAVQIR